MFSLNCVTTPAYSMDCPIPNTLKNLKIVASILCIDKKLIIFGDGDATRDFVHVDDVVDAIILAISNSKNILYNIASGTSTSISDLAKIMISISQKDIKVLHKPKNPGDIKFSSANISLAKEILKFTPKISLKSGLEQFMSK